MDNRCPKCKFRIDEGVRNCPHCESVKKEHRGCLIGIVVFVIIIWTINYVSTTFNAFMVGFIILLVLFVINGMKGTKEAENYAKENREKQKERDENKNEIFNKKKVEYNILEHHLKVNFIRGYAKIESTTQYIWKEDDSLCFFPAIALEDENKYCLYKVPIKDIECFDIQGEFYRETKITGGGGQVGGTSLTGAIVGGVIAGGAGAIIGSRKKGKIEAIKSELITHDNRLTYIHYFVCNEKQSMIFRYKDYEVLQKLIPEKDVNYVNRNMVQNNINSNSTTDIAKQIKELAELKDNGILTEDEFNEKKKILLDKIQ